MTDRASTKWSEYGETVLRFCEPDGFDLDLRRPVDAAARQALALIGLDVPFAVLTAENPEGANAEDAPSEAEQDRRERRNARRRSRLEMELRSRALPHRHLDGVAPDGEYREHCVAVPLPREQAVELAHRFDQLALFWFDGTRFWLIPVDARAEPTPLPVAAGR